MATNLVQDGKTIEIENDTSDVIKSGQAVVMGALLVVAITDIGPGEVGDGMTEGVWLLPKIAGTAIECGARVYFGDAIGAQEEGSISAGIAWTAADASALFVAVKINV